MITCVEPPLSQRPVRKDTRNGGNPPAPAAALLRTGKVLYNPLVRFPSTSLLRVCLSLWLLAAAASVCLAQQAPSPSGARILLLPRKIVSGEHATLAVLDVAGRLTPGVRIRFSDGESVTTDVTGRALFVAPLNPGTIFAGIEGRSGRVSSNIVSETEVPTSTLDVAASPRIASVSDRFELNGHGFCGDADANHVTIGGSSALVLTSSPASLAVLPPADIDPGPAKVQVSCGPKSCAPFTMVFVTLELNASTAPLASGERRTLSVRVHGTTSKVNLEARNLAPNVADLAGSNPARAETSGGADNQAKFEVAGKRHGNFVISIRLISPLSAPRP